MNKSESKYFNTALRMDEALIALLEEKDLEYITVKEICRQAGVNRSTFYLHYEDVYALLDEIGENLIASANLTEISELELSDQDSIHHIILHLVRIVEKNIGFYRVCVLERRTATRLPKQITDELNKTIIKKWEDKGILGDFPDKQYIIDFIQAGFNSIISCWIDKNEKRESAEELAYLIENFLLYGLTGVIN